MTPGELLHREAAKWLDQAAKDRNSAHALIEVEAFRSVFHSQQAAEKALRVSSHFIRLRFGRPMI